jgi:hypothetical protein
MKSKFHMDLVAIVHPTVVHSRPILEKLGWVVLEKPDPVLLDPKKGTAFFRETVMKAGCCGLREMLKLHAFKLKQYKKVRDRLHLSPSHRPLKIMSDFDTVYSLYFFSAFAFFGLFPFYFRKVRDLKRNTHTSLAR